MPTTGDARAEVLRVNQVSVRFEGGSLVQAVEDVSFSVYEGERLSIIGETGSGKSILLLAILRLLGKSAIVSGEALYRGESLMTMNRRRLDSVRGGAISYVPQGSGNGMNPLLRVGFQVGEPLMAHRGLGRREAEARAVTLMTRFHLGRENTLARQYPFTFSGGMRQRALIAMGISAGAELLLADEPTKGLDEKRVRLVADTFNALTDQTLVCVTHDLGFAKSVGSRVGVMYAANMVELAPAEALFFEPLHPYTRDMLAAMPENGLKYRPGFAPAHNDSRVTGCKYRMRCPDCRHQCEQPPPMVNVGGHEVRCWKYA